MLANVEGVIGSALDDTLTGAASNDRLEGAGGNDLITGGAGNDSLLGGSGDDTLEGGAGADVIDGGAGTDIASYAHSGAGVAVDLSGAAGSAGDATGDQLSGIEVLVGSDYADTLGGGAGSESIYGGAGDDVLAGSAGADLLDGGERVVPLLRGLRARHHDVVVFQVLDGDELRLPLEGPTRFEGMEGPEELLADPPAIRAGYREVAGRDCPYLFCLRPAREPVANDVWTEAWLPDPDFWDIIGLSQHDNQWAPCTPDDFRSLAPYRTWVSLEEHVLARRDEHLRHERRLRDAPRERVLARTAADHEDLHGAAV